MIADIVAYLKKGEGYVSGEEISHNLKISRAGIWKYIDQLRGMGYEINAVPHLGYRLESVPDKLLVWEIQPDLKTKICGRRIICHETTASTMDEAFRLGVQGEAEGTVVCAESQTKGRGRLGRIWLSPKGKGIYLSVLLRPQLPPTRVTELTLMAAVAVCEAVNQVAGISARIKWPNDILIDKRKLGGILTEMSADMDCVKFVVVGIGLNVHAVPAKIQSRAVALKEVAVKKVTRVHLVRETLRSLERWYEIVHDQGPGPIIRRWKELSMTLGQRVRIADMNAVIEGQAIGLSPDGGLMIRTNDGKTVKKMSGDVETIMKHSVIE